MNRFRNILFVNEPDVDVRPALERAVTLAEHNQATLTLIDVLPPIPAGIAMPPGGPGSSELQALAVNERRQVLDRLAAPFLARVSIDHKVLVGRHFYEIIAAVLRDGFDLVIKPAQNPGWIERLFGSDDMHLLRKCPCPVWLMKSEGRERYAKIVAAVDFDLESPSAGLGPLARDILKLASSLALLESAKLHIVHAWEAPAEGLIRRWSDDAQGTVYRYVDHERKRHARALAASIDALDELIGTDSKEYLNPQTHLLRGAATDEIPKFVKGLGADLVVMGTVGRSGIPGLFIGNTAEAILDQLTCAVLAIKPQGFVSPVRLESLPK